jgi:hypothetical protein
VFLVLCHSLAGRSFTTGVSGITTILLMEPLTTLMPELP